MATTVDRHMGTGVELPLINSLFVVSFTTLAWYNVVELTILIQAFFKRHSGWYYWSLFVATWGIFFHGLGTLFKLFEITHINILDTIIAYLGWIMMVSGQSIVLYSRLHLVVHAPWKRWVLVMIIVNGILMHGSTGVLTFLTNLSADPGRWRGPYSIVERLQVTVFFVQEATLSGIYIWKTASMLQTDGPLFTEDRNVHGGYGRKVLRNTIWINILIICLEVTLVGLEFSGLYDIQTSFKGAVYSIKLKLEFTILNQLMNLVKGNLAGSAMQNHISDSGPLGHRETRGSNHSGLRSGIRREERLFTGSYIRMEDDIPPPPKVHGSDSFRNEGMKATATEVKIEKTYDGDSIDEHFSDNRFGKTGMNKTYLIEHA